MRRPFWSCAAALAMLALCPAAATADGGAEIEWTAPAECPDREAFVRQLDEFLGLPVASLNSVYIAVRVAPGADGWHMVMTLRVRENSGERAFDGADCAELTASAAISAALSLDPSVLADDPERRRGIEPVWDGEVPPDADLSTPPPPPPPPAPIREGLDIDASARVLIGADANGMPRTSLAVGALFGLQYWRVRIEGGPMYWPTQTRDDTNDAGIEMSRFVARLAACFRARWRLQLCGITEVGQVTSTSFGYTDIFGQPVDTWRRSTFEWAPGAAAGISFPVSKSIGFRIDTEVVGWGYRPRLTVPPELMNEGTELYQRAAVVFRAFAGLELVIR